MSGNACRGLAAVLARSTKQAGDVGLFVRTRRRPTREKRDEKYDKASRNFYTRVEYVTVPDWRWKRRRISLPSICPTTTRRKPSDRIYGACPAPEMAVHSRWQWQAETGWIVMNPGVHKGAALAKVGALLGIPADSMMAFGDTYNDAEMLTTAKYGFLMENGSGPLRAQVPFLAPSHRNTA
ncbi:MAG: HAD family hydrolase [Faecalibacterium prausnitzii]